MSQAVEDFLVQAFVPQDAVEAFDEAVLLWLARVDVMPLDGVLVGPLQDRLASELGPIVTDNATGFAVNPDQCIKLPRHSGPRDAGVCNQGKVLAAAVVVDCQDAELAAGPERVGHRAMGTPPVRVTMARVQGPALVRSQRHRH